MLFSKEDINQLRLQYNNADFIGNNSQIRKKRFFQIFKLEPLCSDPAIPVAVELKNENKRIEMGKSIIFVVLFYSTYLVLLQAEENMTEDQKLRLLREEVVTLRVEAPKIMLRLLEQAKQHKMQNMVRLLSQIPSIAISQLCCLRKTPSTLRAHSKNWRRSQTSGCLARKASKSLKPNTLSKRFNNLIKTLLLNAKETLFTANRAQRRL